MANYTAADIKALREQTGAGMIDVKKALDEADGDRDKAVEILRVKGQKGVAKREGRNASNGLVADPRRRWRRHPGRGQLRDRLRGQGREVPGPGRSRCSTRPWPSAPPTPRRCCATRSSPARRSARSARRGQRHHRREDRGPPGRPRRGCRRGVLPAQDQPRPARRRSACWSRPRAATRRSPATSRCTSPRSPERTSSREEVAGRDGRDRAPDRRGTAREEGKPEAALPKIVEGRVERLLQGERAARAAVRQGRQEDRRRGARGGRRQGRSPSPGSGSAPDPRPQLHLTGTPVGTTAPHLT